MMATKSKPPEVVPVKKSIQEQLDDLDDAIKDLEEKRKELLFEVEKEEVRKQVLEDQDFYEEIHKECPHRGEIEAREEAEGLEDEAWAYLQDFGAHSATCRSGALVGSQALHPLCTCGWNHVATQLEKA